MQYRIMQHRTEIIEQFSTFLQFADGCTKGWVADPRLRRSILTQMAEQDSPNTEEFWVLYWHQRWLQEQAQLRAIPSVSQALSQAHLSAYLQESCYWAASKLVNRVTKSSSSVCDCFQVAIAKLSKVLQACDPNHHVSLKTYSKVAFENIIRDALRQQYEVNLCNDWALLLRTSRKQLQEALQQIGLNQAVIELHSNAHQCYLTGYQLLKSTSGQIQRPDSEGWRILIQLYHQQFSAPIDAATLEQRLLTCAKQVRTYLYPLVTSLNVPRFEQSEWQDEIVDQRDAPLIYLITQEDQEIRQSQQAKLNAVLSAALDQLEPQAQTLLKLYYQENLTQQAIAQQLEMPQYTVSRRLSKARELLLLALMRWSKSTLHIEPTSIVIKHISALLEEWLQTHYDDACAELVAQTS